MEGYSYREVAAKLGHGVTPSGIRKLFKRFQPPGDRFRGKQDWKRPQQAHNAQDWQTGNKVGPEYQTGFISSYINKELREIGVKDSRCPTGLFDAAYG